MRRLVPIFVLTFLGSLARAASGDQAPTAVVQRLFDAMAAHNAADARALFIPEAMLLSVTPDNVPMAIPYEKWLVRLGTSKDAWLERIWNTKVLEHGSVAVVWADYDFHLNGRFSHCGVDSFSLLKTAAGWKIAAIADTRETSGCPPSPLDAVTK